MQLFFNNVQDKKGNAIANADVIVTNYPSGTPATIYSADDPIPANEIAELQTNSEGEYQFYVPNGRYTVTIKKNTQTLNVIENFSIFDGGASGSSVQVEFRNVAQMEAAQYLQVGWFANTKGYFNPGDGGGNDYEIVAAGTGTDNSGSFIDLSGSGLQAKGLFVDGLIVPEQFGCSTSLCTTELQAAFDYAAGKQINLISNYLVDDAISVSSNTKVIGSGGVSCGSTLATGGSGIGMRLLDVTGATGVDIQGITLDCSEITVFLAGARAIFFNGSTKFKVRNCDIITPGAAVVCIQSNKFDIIGNNCLVSSTDGISHHDGILDTFDGCEDYRIDDNEVDGGSLPGNYGILATGESSTGTAAACRNFKIRGNTVRNVDQVGIWSNGREGVNENFEVSGNTVEDVASFYGIAVADTINGSVENNHTLRTAGNGIRLHSEPGAGGITSANNVTVKGNHVTDANQSLNAGVEAGSAIVVTNSSANNVVEDNFVFGSDHVNALFLNSGTSGNTYNKINMQTGTSGVFLDQSALNLPDTNTYIPTLTNVSNVSASSVSTCKFTVYGDVVHVTVRISVTPSAASTLTEVGLSLPILSTLSSTNVDLIGTANTGFTTTAVFRADSINERASLQFQSQNTAANVFYGIFSYVLD
jgi:hypothetical protein